MKTFTTVSTIIVGMAYLALCTPIMNQIYTTTTHWFSEKNNQPNPTKSLKSKVAFEPQSFKGVPFVIEPKQEIVSPIAVTIAATLSAAVVTDNAPTGASATDVLEYTAVVSNSGSTDATGVTFTDVLDNNTTLVAGSITSTPIAVNDNYTCVGNVGIVVNAASGVLANDVSPTNIARTVTAASGATANGTYSIAADGSFSYTPNAGFTGTNSFTYTLNTGSLTATATVSITVSGMIWFVNPSVSSSGTGTLLSPFKALTNVTGTATGNTIFLYTGTYTGSLTLLASQKLIGQGATASLASITGLTFTNAPAGVPATGGTNPTWNAATLTINSGNDVQGINLNSASGTTMTGSSVGVLKVRNVSLSNTAGQALQITAGGALDVQFKSISAAGAAKGLSVNSCTGSFQVLGTGTTAGSGGTISNITTRGAEFSNVSNITLTNMNFTNANTASAASSATDYATANGAITLNNVSGATLTKIAISGTTRERGVTGKTISNFTLNGGSTLTDCGDDVNEGCLYLQELTRTCNINDATLSKGSENIARVFNSSGTLTLNIGTDATTTIFNDTQTQNANMASPGALSALRSYCFIYSGAGTATATLNARNTSFLKAGTHGFKVISDGSGAVNANVKSCTFNNDNPTFSPNDQGGSIELTAFNSGVMNYNLLNNSCRGKDISLINIVAQVNSIAQGRVNDNTVTISGTGSAGEGIRLSAEGSSDITTEVLRNTVSAMGTGVGILAISSGGDGKMNATILNNTITITDALASHNIQVQAGNSSSTFSNTTCANVANNITSRPDLVNGFNFRVRAITTAPSTHKLYLQGTGTTSAEQVWTNNGNTPTGAVVAQAGTFGTHIFSSTNGGALATCAVPSNTTYSLTPPPVAEVTTKADTMGKVSTESRAAVEAAGGAPSVILPSGGSPESLLSGETVTVNGSGTGFTLPAAKSTTIKFRAIINSGIAAGTCAVSTQGTVSSTMIGFVSVLTDDPSVMGTANPTSTTIVSAPVITTCPAALNICSNASQTFAAVASGCPTPTLTYKIGSTIITSPHVFLDGSSTVDVTVSNGIGANATCSFIVNNTFTLPTATPPTGLSVTQNVSNPIFKNNCDIYATVTPLAPSPIAGSTTVKTWLETGAFSFVKRHYEITPSANVSTAMATIILYFTQTDFDDYNAANGTKLPLNAADLANNKANLQIVKYAGSALNGLPAQYGTVPSIITPTSVVWNGNFWVVTFNVTGFSGFFVKTSSVILPVTLLSFEGKKLKNNTNLLTWHVAEEKDLKAYHVEKSIDGKTFEQAGIVKAKGSNSVYEFTDNNPNGGLSGVYYRLKMIDLDEKFEYSNIINLENDKILRGVKIYPNPTSNIVNIEIEGSLNKSIQVSVKDISGRVVLQQTLSADNSTINMSSMSDGLYILEAQFADGQKQSFKLVKQ
jgi:trimeric autotransporter adhesin